LAGADDVAGAEGPVWAQAFEAATRAAAARQVLVKGGQRTRMSGILGLGLVDF
jgi:hypothetical protein